MATDTLQQVPLAVQLTCRGDSLAKDSYLKNAYIEADPQGAYAVKRPGLKYLYQMTIPGAAPYYIQGQCVDPLYGLLCVSKDTLVGPLIYSTLSIPLAAAPGTDTANNPYGMVTGWPQGIVLQSPNYIYIYNWATWTKIAQPDTGYFARPGLAVLDGTFYLSTSHNRIYGSALGDATTWPALNYVSTDPAIGQLITITRHLNYIMAFAQNGIQFFYDAGIYPGAALAPVPNALSFQGCLTYGGQAIASLDDITYWVGSSNSFSVGVLAVQGLSIAKISTPEVDRLLMKYFLPLNSGAGTVQGQAMHASAFHASGHSYYLLTAPTNSGAAGITLAFDISTKTWAVWSQTVAGVEKEMQLSAVLYHPLTASFGGSPGYSMDAIGSTDGSLYKFDLNTYQDNGQPIPVVIQTDLVNWGSSRTKLIAATYPVLDTLPSSVQLSWTDDDYQTFSVPQAISTATTKKQLVRCGSTTQRAWKLAHSDNTPMSFYTLEIEVLPGAL